MITVFDVCFFVACCVVIASAVLLLRDLHEIAMLKDRLKDIEYRLDRLSAEIKVSI